MQSTPKRVLFLCPYVVLHIRKPYIKDRRERNEHLMKRETIDFMQSGGIGGVGRGKIYLVGAGVGGARNSHAGCGVCAPAARGEALRGGGYARLRRAGGTERGRERGGAESGERRHAPSRRLRHRLGAHHRLLPRHRQRQRMLHVPTRHQSCGSLIKNRL